MKYIIVRWRVNEESVVPGQWIVLHWSNTFEGASRMYEKYKEQYGKDVHLLIDVEIAKDAKYIEQMTEARKRVRRANGQYEPLPQTEQELGGSF